MNRFCTFAVFCVIVLMAAGCGSGSSAPSKPGPIALPPPGSAVKSASLCRNYFGSPGVVAKEFRIPSLKLTYGGAARGKPYSVFQCGYEIPGPARTGSGFLLTLTTHSFPIVICGVCGPTSSANSGDIYAYLTMDEFTNIHLPENIQAWLHVAAARAKPSK
jgi:hypothetical protein